jgi:hypothetical protein
MSRRRGSQRSRLESDGARSDQMWATTPTWIVASSASSDPESGNMTLLQKEHVSRLGTARQSSARTRLT